MTFTMDTEEMAITASEEIRQLFPEVDLHIDGIQIIIENGTPLMTASYIEVFVKGWNAAMSSLPLSNFEV